MRISCWRRHGWDAGILQNLSRLWNLYCVEYNLVERLFPCENLFSFAEFYFVVVM
jgi:hypothetical protein